MSYINPIHKMAINITADVLANAGFRKVKNLRGGINAWAREIDPALPQY